MLVNDTSSYEGHSVQWQSQPEDHIKNQAQWKVGSLTSDAHFTLSTRTCMGRSMMNQWSRASQGPMHYPEVVGLNPSYI